MKNIDKRIKDAFFACDANTCNADDIVIVWLKLELDRVTQELSELLRKQELVIEYLR